MRREQRNQKKLLGSESRNRQPSHWLWISAMILVSQTAHLSFAQDTSITKESLRAQDNTRVCHEDINGSENCDTYQLADDYDGDISLLELRKRWLAASGRVPRTALTHQPEPELQSSGPIAASRYLTPQEMSQAYQLNFQAGRDGTGLVVNYLIPNQCRSILKKSGTHDFYVEKETSKSPVHYGLLFQTKDGVDAKLAQECTQPGLYKTCHQYYDAQIEREERRWKADRLQKEKAEKATQNCEWVSAGIEIDFSNIPASERKAVVGVAVPGSSELTFNSQLSVTYVTPEAKDLETLQSQIAQTCNVEEIDPSGLAQLESDLLAFAQAASQSNRYSDRSAAQAVLNQVQAGRQKVRSKRQELIDQKEKEKIESLLAPLGEEEIKSHARLLRELEELAARNPEYRERAVEKQLAIFDRWLNEADDLDIMGSGRIMDRLLSFIGSESNLDRIGFSKSQRLLHRAIQKIETVEELEDALNQIMDSNWALVAEEDHGKDYGKTIGYLADRVEKYTDGNSAEKSKASLAVIEKAADHSDSDELAALKVEREADMLKNKASFDGPLGQAFMQSMMAPQMMGMMGGMGGMMMGGNPMMMMMGFNSMMGMTRLELQMKSYQYMMGRMTYCGANYAQFGVQAKNTQANQTLCNAYTQGYNQLTQADGMMRMYDSMRQSMLGNATGEQGPNAHLIGGGMTNHPRAMRNRQQTPQQNRQTAGQHPRGTVDLNSGTRTRVTPDQVSQGNGIQVPNPARAEVGAP